MTRYPRNLAHLFLYGLYASLKKTNVKGSEMLLLSFLFITDVFFLKVICIMKLRNNFNEQKCLVLVKMLGQ